MLHSWILQEEVSNLGVRLERLDEVVVTLAGYTKEQRSRFVESSYCLMDPEWGPSSNFLTKGIYFYEI